MDNYPRYGPRPRLEDMYNPGYYLYDSSSSSDGEPKTMGGKIKKKLKSTFSPTERARIAAEKAEDRRRTIECGWAHHLDGYPNSLTAEERELEERIRLNPELRRIINPDARPINRPEIFSPERYRPGESSANQKVQREEYKPDFGRTVRDEDDNQRINSGSAGSNQHGSSGGRLLSLQHLLSNGGYSNHSRVPSSRASHPHDSQTPKSPFHNPPPPPAYTQSSTKPSKTSTNPRHFATQPNMTIAHSTPPSSSRIPNKTAFANLGDMNRTYIEGFDTSNAKQTMPAAKTSRQIGNMERTHLNGIVEEDEYEDEDKDKNKNVKSSRFGKSKY